MIFKLNSLIKIVAKTHIKKTAKRLELIAEIKLPADSEPDAGRIPNFKIFNSYFKNNIIPDEFNLEVRRKGEAYTARIYKI